MTPAVEFENVSFTYRRGGAAGGDVPALEGISLRVDPGELLAVVGPNGGGKSTLLRLMLGLLDGYSGTIKVCGLAPKRAQRMGYTAWVPQKSEARSGFPLSARQAVEMGATRSLRWWQSGGVAARERVDRALRAVGAVEYADRPVGRLSGGQFQRILIARALASDAKVLALDEPTVGIDAVGQKQFSELVRMLHKDLGLTVLLVSHDLRTIAGGAATCDRVACLRKRVHFHASPKGITPQVLADVFQHDLADMFGDVHIDAHRASECGHEHVHPAAGLVQVGGVGKQQSSKATKRQVGEAAGDGAAPLDSSGGSR